MKIQDVFFNELKRITNTNNDYNSVYNSDIKNKSNINKILSIVMDIKSSFNDSSIYVFLDEVNKIIFKNPKIKKECEKLNIDTMQLSTAFKELASETVKNIIFK